MGYCLIIVAVHIASSRSPGEDYNHFHDFTDLYNYYDTPSTGVD